MPLPRRILAVTTALALVLTAAPLAASADSADFDWEDYSVPGRVGLVVQEVRNLGIQSSYTADDFGALLAPVCAGSEQFCISDLRAGPGSSSIAATYLGRAPGAGTTADPNIGTPAGGSVTLWDIPGLPHKGGATTYAATVSIGYSVTDDGYRVDDTYGIVTPYTIVTGYYPHPDETGCVFSGDGLCAKAEDFADGTRVSLSFRMPDTVGGWFRGRITNPAITVDPYGDAANEITVEADVTTVPAVGTTIDYEEAFDEFGIENPNDGSWEVRQYAAWDAQTPQVLNVIAGHVGDTAVALPNFWSFNQLVSESTDCAPSNDEYIGFVTTNAMAYEDRPPTFEDGVLTYDVAGLHYNPDGSVYQGTYDLVLRSDVARCLYGYGDGAVTATVTIAKDSGVQAASSTLVEEDGWLHISVSGITFSAPEVRVKLNQAAPKKLTGSTPRVAGTMAVGSTVTASAGTWGPGSVTLKYQWFRDYRPVSGATKDKYKLTSADAGKPISVAVTGSKSGYPSLTKTSAVRSVPSKPVVTSSVPKITGTVALGKTLTATAGSWGPSGVTLKYQWYRDRRQVSGATGKTYKLTSADIGKPVSVMVTGSKSGYTSSTQVSTERTLKGTLTAKTPTISGSTAIGMPLTAKAGTWGPAPVTLKYQWNRDGKPIAGATGSAYQSRDADAGNAITVSVTGSRSGYTTVTRTSAAKTIQKLLTARTPEISGNPTVGNTLTAVTAAWGPSPVALTYQWRRNGGAITGATSASYLLEGADEGATITVTVSGTKTGYTKASRTSSGVVVTAPVE